MLQDDNTYVNSATAASRYSMPTTGRWRSSVVPAPSRVASVIPGVWRWILLEIFTWPIRKITVCRSSSGKIQDPGSKIQRRSKFQTPKESGQPQLLGSWVLELLWILDPGSWSFIAPLSNRRHALPVHPPALLAAAAPGTGVGDLVC